MAGLNKAMTAPPGAYPEDVVPAVPPPVGPPPFEAVPPEMDPNSEAYQRMLADYMLQQALSQAPGAAMAAGRGAALGINDIAQDALGGALNYGLGTIGGVVGGSDPGMQDIARMMREQGISDLAPYAAGAAVGPGASAIGSKLGPYVLPAVEKTLQFGSKIPGATQAGKAVSAAAGPAAVAAGPAAVLMSGSGEGQAMDPAQFVEPLPADVKAKQAKLKSLGLYNGPIDGVEGGGTKRGENAYYKMQSSPEVRAYLEQERGRQRQAQDTAAMDARARAMEAETAKDKEQRAQVESKRQYYNEQRDRRQEEASFGERTAEYVAGALPAITGAAGLGKGYAKSRGAKRRMDELERASSPGGGYIGSNGRPLAVPPDQRAGFVDAYDKATATKTFDGADKAMYGALGLDFAASLGKGQFLDKANKDEALAAYYGPEGTPADAEAAANYEFNEDLMRQFSNSALPAAVTYTGGKLLGEAGTDAFTGRTKEPPFTATTAAETFRTQNRMDADAIKAARSGGGSSITQKVRDLIKSPLSWGKKGAGFAGNKLTSRTAQQANQQKANIANYINNLSTDPQVAQRVRGMTTAKGNKISVTAVSKAYNLNRKQAQRLIDAIERQAPPTP